MWYAIDIVCETEALEAVQYALMEAGASGVEEIAEEQSNRTKLSAYFEALPEIELVMALLADALRIYSVSSPVGEPEVRQVEERDWLAQWKAGWQPLEVGERFLVAPPWSETGESDGRRIVIRVEPGMAFGTGTHETTRLCLEALETYFEGESFLDVGTGTGILAIAAAKLAPHARIEACDTDPEAIEIARENARLNGVAERIKFWEGTIEESTASAACVCANLTADVILPLLPALINASCERLILSGILTPQSESITARLHELGVDHYELKPKGEWVAIISC